MFSDGFLIFYTNNKFRLQTEKGNQLYTDFASIISPAYDAESEIIENANIIGGFYGIIYLFILLYSGKRRKNL